MCLDGSSGATCLDAVNVDALASKTPNSNAVEMVVVHVCSCSSDLHEVFYATYFRIESGNFKLVSIDSCIKSSCRIFYMCMFRIHL